MAALVPTVPVCNFGSVFGPPCLNGIRLAFLLLAAEPCLSFPWSFCFVGAFLAGDLLGLFECLLLALQIF